MLGALRFLDGFVMTVAGFDASASSSGCFVSPVCESLATGVGRALERNTRVGATVVTDFCDPS